MESALKRVKRGGERRDGEGDREKGRGEKEVER